MKHKFGSGHRFIFKSPPVRGAWIETLLYLLLVLSSTVAPRAGGVD